MTARSRIGKPAARLGDNVECPKHGTVSIVSGSPNTFHNGRSAARIGDTTSCGDTIIEGGKSVLINGQPAAFLGCATAHGGKIITGSPTIYIDATETIINHPLRQPSDVSLKKFKDVKAVRGTSVNKVVSASASYKQSITASTRRSSNKHPNDDMFASDNAARFTASFEAIGFVCPDGKVRAYQDRGCSKGFWTIGLGEMTGRTKDSTFESEEEAYSSFVKKIKGEYSQRVRLALRKAGVKRRLNQNEFDALTDLAYQKGNCKKLAERIAKGHSLEESDFVEQTGIEHKRRRIAEFNLYSGKEVNVKGHTRFLRRDDTNGGYCPLKNGKSGYSVQRSDKVFKLEY